MMDLYVVGRAVGKTTFTLEMMYREPDWLLIVGFESEVDRLAQMLAQRCMDDGPPPWFEAEPYATPIAWMTWWRYRIVTPAGFQRSRGLINRPRVAIDNLDHVLQAMFGNVEMATATGIIPHQRIPSLPRTKCQACGGPYDEDSDSWDLCATCISDSDNWKKADPDVMTDAQERTATICTDGCQYPLFARDEPWPGDTYECPVCHATWEWDGEWVPVEQNGSRSKAGSDG